MQRTTLPPMKGGLKRRLRQTSGVIDLASIMVGVIIAGILSTGIVATTFALVPFSQDAAAEQALDSVKTAEGAAFVSGEPNRYLNMDGLVAGEWIQASSRVGVETNADGTCFAAMSHSETGNQFWTDNTTAEILPYVDGTSTSPCADLAAMSGSLTSANPGGTASPGGGGGTVALAGVVTTLAGSGVSGFADGTGNTAEFNSPTGVAVNSEGTVYVVDFYNHRIREITPAGVVTTLAGSGVRGFADGTGDTAKFNSPYGIEVNSEGTIYVSDTGNNRIRKITPAGVVTTLAGSGVSGFADGPGTDARFDLPRGITVDSMGTIYVSDEGNNRIRKITPAGVVTTLAGSGVAGFADGTGDTAKFDNARGIAVNSEGSIYVSDTGNNRIREITPTGVVTTFAGSGVAGFADGTGTDAQFNYPAGIAINSEGTIYVSDTKGQRIRRITPAGVVTTLAGSGVAGFADGTGTAAQFNVPHGLTVDPSGALYVAELTNNRIRKIE